MTNRVGPHITVRRPVAESEDAPDKKRQNRSTLTTSHQPLTFSLIHLPVGSPAMSANSPYTLRPLPPPSPASQSELTFHMFTPPAAAASSFPSPSPAAASSSSSAPRPSLSPAASKQLPKEESLSDGSIVRVLPNGAIMRRYPDGKIELTGKNQVRNVPAKSDFEIKLEEKREQMRIERVATLKEVEEVRRRYLPPPIQFGNPPIQAQPLPSRSSTRHEDADETGSNSDTEIPRMEELTIAYPLPKS